ncbi:17076_t:CDS:2, partial [Racocetra fulgida]
MLKISMMQIYITISSVLEIIKVIEIVPSAAIIFNNDLLLSATLTLNDGTSNTVNLDALSCVIINRENFLKIVDLAEVNEKDQIIIEENHEVIQAEDINLDRQPSDLSLEIEMDIQENTAQNTESSFDLEEDGTDNNGFDNPISQLLEENEFSDTDEKIDEIIFDSLILSSGISSAKSNITKYKYNINEAFKVAKNNYTKNDRSGIEYAPSTLTEDSPLPSVNEALAVLQSNEYPVTSSREKSNDIVVLYKRRKKNKSNINKDRTPENQLNYENVNNPQ